MMHTPKKNAVREHGAFQTNHTPDQRAHADYNLAYCTLVNSHPSDELALMRKLYLLAAITAEMGKHRGVGISDVLEVLDGMCCSASNGLAPLVRQQVFLDLKLRLRGAGGLH